MNIAAPQLSELVTQLLEIGAALAAAPLFLGWVNQCRAWLANRRAPSVWLPYRNIRKLFEKDAVLAENASPLFRLAPYVVFSTMVVAAGIIPSMGTRLPLVVAADAIALVGLFATARVFLSLAAMDIGTAFGTLGARREMMVGFLAEPALLMVIFVASLISATTALPAISEHLATQSLGLYPSLAFTAVAFTLVLLAENARIPVDNPATHLELTMIHEALLLEYSARHLALMEWASALRLFNYACIGFALFVPWGVATGAIGPLGLALSVPVLTLKLLVAGAGLAMIETVSAKLRVMRAPEFLASAFLFAVLGLLVHVLLKS
ncbi:MAG: respiratory chain complex I subunit 1 family protein [Steroidobacteraceae bacterium]